MEQVKIGDTKLTIKLPTELRDNFRKVVEAKGDKASKILRAAIEQYIKKNG